MIVGPLGSTPHGEWGHDSDDVLVWPASWELGQANGVKVRRVVFLGPGASRDDAF